jgi:hypothetical protein
VNSILAGAAAYGLLYLFAPVIHTDTFLGLLIQAALSFGGGLIVYIILSFITKVKEIAVFKIFLRELFAFGGRNNNQHGTK